MFFPHVTEHQLVVNMANSAKETNEFIQQCSGRRSNELDELFAKRVHELMRYRSHTVNTDGADF